MSENSTSTPQEPAGTKKKSLVPTALILTLAGVGAYGIYTGNVTDWVNQGIDKVSNPTELFASDQEASEARSGKAPNLFPDDYELTYPDSENASSGAQAPAPTQEVAQLSPSQAETGSTITSERAVATDDGTGRARYVDDLSRDDSQEPDQANLTDEVSNADGVTDDYQLDFGGSRSTSGGVTATGSPSDEASSPSPERQQQASTPGDQTEDQAADDSSSTPIPEPEEMEAELARILAERESGPASDSDGESEAAPMPAGESTSEALSEEERQQIMASPEFTGTIAAIGRRVGQSWQYEGDDYDKHGAIVKVHLEDAGEAGDITISRSSGNDAYDASVLSAAQDAAPFHEVLELDDTAQTLLTDFSLTFGSREAIEAWEAQWTVQEPAALQEEIVEEDPSYAAQVRRMIEAEWDRPDAFEADREVSVQVRLAVPFGNVLAINFLRPSDDEAVNESISEAIRAASPFDGIRQLSLKEQQELQQFNLHFQAEGIR